jgi:hypothetical protein
MESGIYVDNVAGNFKFDFVVVVNVTLRSGDNTRQTHSFVRPQSLVRARYSVSLKHIHIFLFRAMPAPWHEHPRVRGSFSSAL